MSTIYPGTQRISDSFQTKPLDGNYDVTTRVGASFTSGSLDVNTLLFTSRQDSTGNFVTNSGFRFSSRDETGNFVTRNPWTFGELSPLLWLKGDSSVTKVGDDVSLWEDFRINGITAVQNSAPLRPSTSTLNFRQVVDMGQGKELDLVSELTNVRSFLLVVDDIRPSDGSPSVSSLFQEDSSTTPAQGAFIRVDSADFTINLSNVGGNANTGSASINGGSLVTPNPASPLVDLGVNPTTGSGPFIFYGQYDNVQRVGRFGNIDDGVVQRRGDNHIAEYVFFDSVLSSDDVDRAVGRLAHDWSLLSLLPGNHPYKTQEPEL